MAEVLTFSTYVDSSTFFFENTNLGLFMFQEISVVSSDILTVNFWNEKSNTIWRISSSASCND
jgi:hypothetical protein